MMKSIVSLVVLAIVLLQSQVIQCQEQITTCSASLNNLNICAPFVVPGTITNPNPSFDCCSALQLVDRECICNTLRIIAHLPSQCNLPPLSC
ncbi:stamen-specific protein FIL1-like [Solanum lycopersicum]|uniref:stamen-specific protein FIL1-like n=1 Tax=Solanum lycopersicum TaxID=4081 RepID=UPI000532F7FB|nr:stamen-specific protein FIL1-like [Solanum lycopersicum]